MEIGMLDEVKVVRRPLIPDDVQLEEIEFVEASIAFANAHNSGRECTELEVDLLNRFMKGSRSRQIRHAWVAYRKRLLFRHRRES